MTPRRSLVVPAPGLAGFLEALPVAVGLAMGGGRRVADRRVAVEADGAEAALLALATAPVAVAHPDDGGWDEAFLLDERLTTARRLARRGVPTRIGRRGGLVGLLRRLYLTATVPEDGDAAGALLAAAGLAAPAPPWLAVDAALAARCEERLARAGLAERPGGLVVVIVGSGARGEPRPLADWASRLQALRRDDPRRRFVLLTATEDLWAAVRLHEETGRLHPVMGPDLDLPLRAALLASADLAVAEDPLARRLAVAVGTVCRGIEDAASL